ncbi:protein FAM185A-like [Crassostrea virginica]
MLARCIKHVLRRRLQACFCSSTSSAPDGETTTHRFAVSNNNPGFLEGKFMATEKFGKLRLDVPFDIFIEPLNPDKYPEMNKMFVKIMYDLAPEETVDSSVLVALRECYDFDVKIQDKTDFTATGNFKSKVEYPVKCVIQLPMKFDLDITARGYRTHIQNMESESITLQASSSRQVPGDVTCTLKNIKCGTFELDGTDCDVTVERLLQGNSRITVEGKGNITTDRLQGLSIHCQTNTGNISSTSVYGQNNCFHSNTGTINLSNCHGKTEVKVKSGDLKIDSLEGDLNCNMEDGNTDVYVTKPDSVSIATERGDIKLKVQEDVNASFDLKGSDIMFDNSLPFTDQKVTEDDPKTLQGTIGKPNGTIKATTASGKISVEAFSWLKSLNLNSSVKE